MISFTNIVGFNQMAGPLFYETMEGISEHYNIPATLVTGHPDTLKRNSTRVKIIPAPKYNRNGNFGRLLSWLLYLAYVMKFIIYIDTQTLILVSTNPPFLVPLFLILGKIKRINYVTFIYDIYPDVLIHEGIFRDRNYLVKLWRFMNTKSLSNSMLTFTLGRYMAETIQSSTELDLREVVNIFPWADTSKIQPIKKELNPYYEKYNPENKLVILYSGNMGYNHDIESILEAAKNLSPNKNILFLIFGEGEKSCFTEKYIGDNNLKNIKLFPLQPENIFPFTLSLADISIVSLEPRAGELMIPSKLFYYMASGAGIIGICDGRNDINDIVEKYDCGFVVAPGSPGKLSQAIEDIYQNKTTLSRYQNNSRIVAEKVFSKRNGINTICNHLDNLNEST
jgi:glycosyltransferase involved in cell wall biosynthesis